jgi:hypothetical protein
VEYALDLLEAARLPRTIVPKRHERPPCIYADRGMDVVTLL